MITPEENTSSVQYKITPDEMWTAVRGETLNWGIEGYEVPKKQFDIQQIRWEKERTQILEKHQRKWPPNDWPVDKESQKKIPPVRLNYIDDYVKWAKSFNDPKKSEEWKENWKAKGIFDPPKAKPVKNERQAFLDHEAEQKKRREELPKIPEYKASGIEAAEAKKKEDEAKVVPWMEKMKNRYSKEKPQMPRCDRVTVVADAEYVGEQIKFYNTPPDKDGDGKAAKLFFPSKTPTYNRAPIWSFDNKKQLKIPTEQMEKRDSDYKEKIDNLKSAKNITDKD